MSDLRFVEATQIDPQHHYDDSDDIVLLRLKDTPTVQTIEPLKIELNAERIVSIFAQKQRLMLVGYPDDYHSGQRLIQLERYLGSTGIDLKHKCRKNSDEDMRQTLPFGFVNCRVTSGGNSGGPLIAMGPEDSRIIGIHTSDTTGEGTAVNLSFHKAFIESILGP